MLLVINGEVNEAQCYEVRKTLVDIARETCILHPCMQSLRKTWKIQASCMQVIDQQIHPAYKILQEFACYIDDSQKSFMQIWTK